MKTHERTIQQFYQEVEKQESRTRLRIKQMFAVPFILLLMAATVGCSVSRQSWEPSAWHVQATASDTPEIGTLQDEYYSYDIVVTELRKVEKVVSLNGTHNIKHPPTILAVIIVCRNTSHVTRKLNEDPIQMVTASASLAKQLTRDEVIFKLYGGRMQEASQLAELKALNQPVRTRNTFVGNVLAGILEAQRAEARRGIINEMFEKEYMTYDVFHESFKSSSLPPCIAYDWIQYYPYTATPIQMIVQGQNIQQGISFNAPMPTQQEITAISKQANVLKDIGDPMQNIVPIENQSALQLTDEDKLRIGIAWDALSPNSRRAYQQPWRSVSDWLSSKDATLSDLTDVQLAAYLSTLDTQCVAPATLSMCVAAVKWYFVNVRAVDVQFPISQKRLRTIRRDAKGRGRGQVDGLIWTDVERVCAFAESDGSISRVSG